MPTGTSASSRTADATGGPTVPPADPDDPREHIEAGVLLPNRRLAGRRCASRAEAEAWARAPAPHPPPVP